MPYERNPFFTGREEDFRRLEEALAGSHTTALTQTQAISGLGGIGKTQTAVEYAYRHREDYAAVFWTAADTVAALTTGFVEIARLLNLPQAQEADQSLAVGAVRRWLETHDGWLLIADNADRPELLKDFRPRRASGRLLLTSRAQVFDMLGVARPIMLETMSPEESAGFLLTRTGRDGYGADEKAAAAELATELGHLPLALEQAGAYITANQASFRDYLGSYHKRRLKLLEKRGPVVGDYPWSVATTWLINFAEVAKTSAAAADLLRASAYLSPDRIPLELLTEGGSELGEALSAELADASESPLIVDEVLEPLLRYSLVSRDVESRAYSIHRLVQVVIQAELSKDGQERLWAERVVRALNRTFSYEGYESWPRCERLVPHVEAAAKLVARYSFTFMEAAAALNAAGLYYFSRGHYKAAEPLFSRAVSILEESGEDQQELATGMNNLASLYERQGRYNEAEPLMQQALRIREEELGAEHPDVATALNILALIFDAQGKYAEAEPLIRRAQDINEGSFGADHPKVAQTLNNLASLYSSQGRYDEADSLFKRARRIFEASLGAEHPDVVRTLNNLAELHRSQGRYAKAERLFKRSLRIREKTLGAEHPDVATALNNLALIFDAQRRYEEAEPLFERALEIRREALSDGHPYVAQSMCNLAGLYSHQGRYDEAEPLMKRALRVREEALGANHHEVANSLSLLAELYVRQGRYDEAEPLMKRALLVREEALGVQHPLVADALTTYTNLLRAMRREAEAKEVESRFRTRIQRPAGKRPEQRDV